MLLIHLSLDLPTWLASVHNMGDVWQGLYWHSPLDWSLIAQQFNTDVFAPFRNFMDNFIESGQVWALLIGLIVGYLLRSLTSYG